MSVLFSDEEFVTALKNELVKLTVEEYLETVKDIRHPKYSEFRVFGRQYLEQDVYIIIRVELVSPVHAGGGHYIFVMSFHFAEFEFNKEESPYKKD